MVTTLLPHRGTTLLLGSRALFTAAVLIMVSSSARETASLVLDRPVTHAASATVPLLSFASLDAAVVPFIRSAKTPVLAAAKPSRPSRASFLRTGLASWYGAVLQDHRTASGQTFNMQELTAAHNGLPFGSKVRVTNLRNHLSVTVTITDRGILSANRIIDLSYAAAEQLNMIKSGVDLVRLEVLPRQQALLAEVAVPADSSF